MNLECKFYSALCDLEIFKINGVQADRNDFGELYDHDRENAPDYGCGDKRFTRITVEKKVLEKYSITEQDYAQVCELLEDKLSFGRCGWCA